MPLGYFCSGRHSGLRNAVFPLSAETNLRVGELMLLESKLLFASVATRRAHEEIFIRVIRVMSAQIVEIPKYELTHFAFESRIGRPAGGS